jgi:hypothetical protein
LWLPWNAVPWFGRVCAGNNTRIVHLVEIPITLIKRYRRFELMFFPSKIGREVGNRCLAHSHDSITLGFIGVHSVCLFGLCAATIGFVGSADELSRLTLVQAVSMTKSKSEVWLWFFSSVLNGA